MHPALYIEEILRAIIDHLEARRPTLQLALTCHTIFDVALRELWKHPHKWMLAETMPEQYRREIYGYHGRMIVSKFQYFLLANPVTVLSRYLAMVRFRRVVHEWDCAFSSTQALCGSSS